MTMNQNAYGENVHSQPVIMDQRAGSGTLVVAEKELTANYWKPQWAIIGKGRPERGLFDPQTQEIYCYKREEDFGQLRWVCYRARQKDTGEIVLERAQGVRVEQLEPLVGFTDRQGCFSLENWRIGVEQNGWLLFNPGLIATATPGMITSSLPVHLPLTYPPEQIRNNAIEMARKHIKRSDPDYLEIKQTQYIDAGAPSEIEANLGVPMKRVEGAAEAASEPESDGTDTAKDDSKKPAAGPRKS